MTWIDEAWSDFKTLLQSKVNILSTRPNENMCRGVLRYSFSGNVCPFYLWANLYLWIRWNFGQDSFLKYNPISEDCNTCKSHRKGPTHIYNAWVGFLIRRDLPEVSCLRACKCVNGGSWWALFLLGSPKPRQMIMGGGGCIGVYMGALFEYQLPSISDQLSLI